jgi:serine/threonine-protein kinase
MELLDGEPLDAHIRGGLPVSEAIPILRAVGRALDAAHAKGIAHRDLKPENIFLASDSDGGVYPKLLDFGIAKLLGEAATTSHRTRTGSPIGTPYYMSPEQCRGQNVDHRTDIYSFGCVAYELLTGHVPFERDNHVAVLYAQMNEEPARPTSRAQLPAAIDDAIAWLMKKDPADRPANLDAAIRALEDAAALPEQLRRTPPVGLGVVRAQTEPGMNRTPAHGVTALAQTMAAAPAHRSRSWWVIGGIAGAAVVAGIALIAASGGEDKPAPPLLPVAPVAVPAPAPPPSPPPAKFVTVHVTGAPAGAQAFGPEGPLGAVPGDLQIPRGEQALQLTFTADGFLTKTVRVTPSADATLEVALDTKPAPAVAKPTPARKPTPRPAAPPTPHEDPYSRK